MFIIILIIFLLFKGQISKDYMYSSMCNDGNLLTLLGTVQYNNIKLS